jgi:hypothetical protein
MRHCLAALRRRPSAQYVFIVVIISAIFPTSFYLMRSAPGFTSSPARVIMTLDGEGRSPALHTLSNDKVMGPSSSKGPPRQRPQIHHVVERILNASELHPESLLSDLLRAEIVCSNSSSSSPPCPVFHPDLHKFENMAQDTASVQLWSKVAQPAALRAISLQMWFEKRMDVAAARVLGCAVVDGHEFTAAFAPSNDLTGTHGMCRLHQQINLVQPLVSHSYRGRFINRTEYLHDPQSNEWFKSFGYNPLHISDSRLAYEAPAFTQVDWMEFCFRQVALQSKTSEVPSTQSRAWYACSSFAASTLSRNYHYGMLKCFDVPSTLMSADATQLTALLSTYGSHRQYVEQCRSNDNGISDDPWSLRDLSRAVFNVLRDRWDVVQSVYELAIYESNRDVQRSDEYVEALQWNTCHPHVQALHLFVETDASAAYFQSIMNSNAFHNPCNKLRSVPLSKRMHYKDALVYANTLVGRTVMIMNADVVLGQGFGSIPDLNSFLKENNRMFALSRHERPARVIQPAVDFLIFSFDSSCFRDLLIVICAAMRPCMTVVMMHSCK